MSLIAYVSLSYSFKKKLLLFMLSSVLKLHIILCKAFLIYTLSHTQQSYSFTFGSKTVHSLLCGVAIVCNQRNQLLLKL